MNRKLKDNGKRKKRVVIKEKPKTKEQLLRESVPEAGISMFEATRGKRIPMVGDFKVQMVHVGLRELERRESELIAASETLWLHDNPNFRPRRFFGPFTDPLLKQIQIILRQHRAYWYHNLYFDQNPAKSSYERYYTTLPDPDPLPTQPYSPGEYPANDGANNILLELFRVRYRSKYGGSIELEFRMVNDFEYELRKGDLLWDFRVFHMSVFVVPDKIYFNPVNPPRPPSGSVYIEINVDEVFEYSIAQSVIKFTRNEASQELAVALDDLRASLATAGINQYFRAAALSFAYGFIDTEFHSLLLSQEDAVGQIEISDEFCKIIAREREPFFSFYFCISCIHTNWKELMSEHEELRIAMKFWHLYKDGTKVRGPRDVFRISLGLHECGSTPWVFAGAWPLRGEPKLDRLIFKCTVTEEDLIWDDYYGTHENEIFPDYSWLEERDDLHWYGRWWMGWEQVELGHDMPEGEAGYTYSFAVALGLL